MEALGIQVIEILEDERASIPMGGVDPVVPQRTLGFGATSSFVHPASGYMVARAMEISPRVAQALIPPLESLRKRMDAKDSSIHFQTELDKVAEAGWGAVWPADERRQRDFMHFGFELLCKLSPQELRDFFTGFFRLPGALWEHFLSWRLSGIGHIYMGLYVWAKCIPRRFMLPMLIKSIPFIGNRLILPFISREGTPFGDSMYWDAPSDGTSAKWEPKEYYKYLEELTDRKYEGEAFLKTTTSK
jgi:lycopene cyclase-like protein